MINIKLKTQNVKQKRQRILSGLKNIAIDFLKDNVKIIEIKKPRRFRSGSLLFVILSPNNFAFASYFK